MVKQDAPPCPHGFRWPMACPKCEAEKNKLTPAQRKRLEALIRERRWWNTL